MAAQNVLSFGIEDLSFVEELPKHVEIECPVCLQVMLDEPQLISCCGHHFCGPCIERVKASNGPCPMCKEKDYHTMMNKERLRIINGLQVYCTNYDATRGCQWKGELKNLSNHLNKGQREGECLYEKVKCRYNECEEKNFRPIFNIHEKFNCSQRPYQCQYCNLKRTYVFITEDHYEKCCNYPVSCPNNCETDKKFPRYRIFFHLSLKCPLQPVECAFSWAGCTDTPLRKDSQSHTTDLKHMSMLAVSCGKLKHENEKLKMLYNAVTDSYPVLPVTINNESGPVHAYTHLFGHHISFLYCVDDSGESDSNDGYVYIAFHEGKFDMLKPKLPSLSTAEGDLLLTDTGMIHNKLDNDILSINVTAPGVVCVAVKTDGAYEVVIVAN